MSDERTAADKDQPDATSAGAPAVAPAAGGYAAAAPNDDLDLPRLSSVTEKNGLSADMFDPPPKKVKNGNQKRSWAYSYTSQAH